MNGIDRTLAARTAAGIYAGAAFVGLLEGAIPGGEDVAPLPSAVAVCIAVLIFFVGVHLPMRALYAAKSAGRDRTVVDGSGSADSTLRSPVFV